jgi:hypothetical protein
MDKKLIKEKFTIAIQQFLYFREEKSILKTLRYKGVSLKMSEDEEKWRVLDRVGTALMTRASSN